MKVGILTLFNGVDRSYSIVSVVAQQLSMLLENHVPVKMIVNEQFDENTKFGVFLDDRIEWAKVSNTYDGKQITWIDYSNPTMTLHDSFNNEVKVITDSLRDALRDIDVCIMHDILYQGWHYIHNVAVRALQPEFPNIRFVAFTHSFPVNRPLAVSKQMQYRYVPMDNTIFAYPSYSGIQALAKQYHVPEGMCRVVYNSMSLIEDFSEDTRNLHNKVNLLDSDILIVYPARLTPGKQPEKIVQLAGAIQTVTEKTIKVIFCDFKCMDIDPVIYKNMIRQVGTGYGLEDDNIMFTSDYGYENGFPRNSVLELFTLSNLYICPSKSESFGLSVIEAASRGNFIVLNENVPALRELGSNLKSYFMKWDARCMGYDTKAEYNPNEAAYYGAHAKRIVDLMRQDHAIYAKSQIRSRYSNNWIWRNQLQPLLQGFI